MTWLADHWLDLFGWAGSALLIVSLLQARVLRFRVLNLTAGLMLVAFNALIGVWPMVAMNLATSHFAQRRDRTNVCKCHLDHLLQLLWAHCRRVPPTEAARSETLLL